MESAQSEKKESGKQRLTPEAAAEIRKQESLRLARVHLQEQMKATKHPRHREMLERALGDLEKQLEALAALARVAGAGH
jgi:uncharacterized FlaG/YvyC family protein